MMMLRSYVQDRWVEGKGSAATLVNPATEEPLAQASTAGIDMAAALQHARDVGGPGLRAMTYGQRGDAIRAWSKAIHAKRDELIDLAMKNGGNTRGDAKFDVDGAIGTLAHYADLGAALGAQRCVRDGDPVQLGRTARYAGLHVWVPREGVAVHINAFNFPAWGTAEKAACALLAGMPVISKPATSTAIVAYRLVEIAVETKALPPGALAFLCGSPGDLLERLTPWDVLAFTGGAPTAKMLRSKLAPLGVRYNIEADSLNAAVLAPDVEPGGSTWDLFVADVARDMTQKAGQKCTAIRRIFVPKSRADDVQQALMDRLAAIKVGDPARAEVTMGPVSTADQKRDVLDGILKATREAHSVFGGRGDVQPLAPEGKGFFVGPVLLRTDEPQKADFLHSHEVFGPAATLMVIDAPAQDYAKTAAQLVRRGNGGLVCSAFGDDKQLLAELALQLAPAHGRLYLGSEKVAGQTFGPGTVLPQLIHGGPGHAGGGEELGGLRGLQFYSQRTAIQGERQVLDAIAPPPAPSPAG